MTQAGIECFLAICRHKTTVAAARALYITQPSLSARLKSLEQEVGVPLFYRSKGSREMQLTGTGLEFHRLALQYEALIDQMKTLGDEKKDTLRVACFSSLDTYLFVPVYRLFLQKYPQYSLQMQDVGSASMSQFILQGTSDVAFTVGRVFNNQLQRVPIFSEPMVLVCAADATLRAPAALTQLQPQKEIFVEWSSEFVYWHQEVLGYSHPAFCVSTMVQLQQFLEQENGWSIVPISVAKGLIAAGNIRQVETAFSLPHREIAYVVSSQRPVPALDAFLDCLRQVLTTYPEIELLL